MKNIIQQPEHIRDICSNDYYFRIKSAQNPLQDEMNAIIARSAYEPEDPEFALQEIEYFFTTGFFTIEFDNDIYMLMRDFYERHIEDALSAAERIPDYSLVEIGSAYSVPQVAFLSTLLELHKEGKEYATKLLLYMYKTYFRQEYLQLKKFQKLSSKDIILLSHSSGELTGAMELDITARILVMAPILNIAFDESIKVIKCILLERREKFEDYLDKLSEASYIDDDTIDEATEIVAGWMENITLPLEKCKALKPFFRTAELIELAADLGDCHRSIKDYILNLDDTPLDRLQYLLTTVVIGALKHRPKRAIPSFQDALQMAVVYACAEQFILYCTQSNNAFKIRFGMYDRELAKYRPGRAFPDVSKVQTDTQVKAPDAQKQAPAEQKTTQSDHSESEAIEKYRKKLDASKTANINIRKKLDKAQQALLEKDKEIQALRNALAQMKSNVDEMPVKEDVSQADLNAYIAFIKNRKICIVGGHDNWTNKLKQIFPDWRYLPPEISGTIKLSSLKNMECIFFYTDHIGHNIYNKVLDYSRENKIPVGYIASINISNNIQQIYSVLSQSESLTD